MAIVGRYTLLDGELVETEKAMISVTSSAVLYGLSVYSVFFGKYRDGQLLGFRIPEHLTRLFQSARMIGLNGVERFRDTEQFLDQLHTLITANRPTVDQFFRITLHATDSVPGVKTANLLLTPSVFMYNAEPLLPPTGAHLKTSMWRRTADCAIPARAKVNGAYVNSALAKQDALDAGADDCLFLNQSGYVSELSAANIGLVKRGEIITPDCASDILEGITRRSIIELAKEQHIPVTERKVALTELYTADEVFACGTSTFVTPVTEIDHRTIRTGKTGPITAQLRHTLAAIQADPDHSWTTALN